MKSRLLARLLCSLLLLLALPALAQNGYRPQSVPTGGGGSAYATNMDPNMGMAGANMYGSPAYGGAAYGGAAYSGATYGQTLGNASGLGNGRGLLSYGQLEGSYSRTTFDNKDIKATNGLHLGLMTELFKPLFIHVGFSWGSSSGSGSSSSKYDFSTVTLGGGGYIELSNRFHLVGEAGFLYSNLSATRSNLSFSDGAVYLNPYLRFAAAEDFELRAGATVTSADNYDTRVINLGAYYRLFSQMDVGFNAGFGDTTNTYDLGVRFRW